ncbi:hypothetical protein POM88_049903 [Heracleum sosnowskyi]|uniref:DUF7028 domain-containing protein n=1 Tax=Heracleum sosnowskyi TaxID=360622 RepID=A0AAD8GWL0_9APIA|nr:hypothetical protein POM88_049903 [Heracleum sosnowskyi]
MSLSPYIINPRAVLDYYYNSDESGKSRGIKDFQMKAKQHLSAIGWRFYYIMMKDGKRELRYSPPNCKKKYISLRMACKGYLDSELQFRLMSNNVLDSQVRKIGYDGLGLQSRITEVLRGTNVEVMEIKKRRLSFGDVYGERMMICMKGNRDVVEEDDVFCAE